MTVTRSEGNVIQEIDDTNAWKVLKEYLPGDPQDLTGSDAVHLCIGETVNDAVCEDGLLIHATVSMIRETGYIVTPAELAVGTRIFMTRRDPDRITEGLSRMASGLRERRQGRTPLAVLQMDCAGRGGILFGGSTSARTVDPLQAILGKDVPWMGFYSYGEITPVGDIPQMHNYTVALWTLYAD
jgi:hypothetical protein